MSFTNQNSNCHIDFISGFCIYGCFNVSGNHMSIFWIGIVLRVATFPLFYLPRQELWFLFESKPLSQLAAMAYSSTDWPFSEYPVCPITNMGYSFSYVHHFNWLTSLHSFEHDQALADFRKCPITWSTPAITLNFHWRNISPFYFFSIPRHYYKAGSHSFRIVGFAVLIMFSWPTSLAQLEFNYFHQSTTKRTRICLIHLGSFLPFVWLSLRSQVVSFYTLLLADGSSFLYSIVIWFGTDCFIVLTF